MSNPQLKSNQGQQATPIRLAFEDMSENEQSLVGFLGAEGRPVFTIKEMMEGLGWHLGRTGKARGNSRVRNTLRRLVRSNWVTHKESIGDGEYRITLAGYNRLIALAESVDGTAEDAPTPKAAKVRKHRPKTAPPVTETTVEATSTEQPAIEAPAAVVQVETTEAQPALTADEF